MFKILTSIYVIVYYPIAFIISSIICLISFKRFGAIKAVAKYQCLIVKVVLIPKTYEEYLSYCEDEEERIDKIFKEETR